MMQEFDLNTILLITMISVLVAFVAFWVFSLTIKVDRNSTYGLMIESDAQTAFLFDNQTLVDATPDAHQMLGPKTGNTTDWQRLITAFSPQFSTLADDLLALGDAGSLTIVPDSPNDTTRLEAEWWDGLARLVVVNTTNDTDKPLIDKTDLIALETELEILRRTAKLAPYMVWQETNDGKIVWANAAYLALAKLIKPEDGDSSWPPPRLFQHSAEAHNTPSPQTLRISINQVGSGGPLWFDLSCKNVNETKLCFATSADAIVHAETSLKGFIQTLTKTFAHLSIGLAVFDKTRQLALFNPALTELTKLPITFLSARPTLFALLDQLRENQMMPEPKNYKSWRQQMTALEEAAADGTYEGVWTLPGGQTYRVTGRPHADGAVALLFEDISAEISLTRNFREELEVGQSVLDALHDAVVVFSSSGFITMSNVAYTDLWGVDPSTTFGEMSVNDAVRCWQEVCDPTPLWSDLQDFVNNPNDRSEWFGGATLDDGRALGCQFTPLSGGATLVKFHIQKAVAKPVKKRSKARKKPANT